MTNFFKFLGVACTGLGFLFALGVVGAIENNNIALLPGFFLAIIGLAVMGFGCYILNILFE